MYSYVYFPRVGFDGNDFAEPMSKSTEVTYTNVCSCLGTGSISLSVQTDKDAYEIGDSIIITTQVNNQSNKRVRAIEVHLQRIISHTFTTIAYIGDINVQATGSFSWNSHLEIPFTPISMHNMGAMNVSYFLQVTVVVSSFARNVCIQLPIKIIHGAKTVAAMQSYAAPLLGPMMQAYGTPQAPGVGALGPETTQEHVTSYNEDKHCM